MSPEVPQYQPPEGPVKDFYEAQHPVSPADEAAAATTAAAGSGIKYRPEAGSETADFYAQPARTLQPGESPFPEHVRAEAAPQQVEVTPQQVVTKPGMLRWLRLGRKHQQ